MVNAKNKWTLSPLGFDPDLSGPVGEVSNLADWQCLINSKIYHNLSNVNRTYQRGLIYCLKGMKK